MAVPPSGSSVAEALGNAFRLNSDRQRAGQEAFTASPFSRLMITHVVSLAGDALVTLGLAGSIFFSTDLHAARGRVTLTLLLTIAPFAVVAPLLGPIIDKTRGGRRAMVVATALGRAVACFLMAQNIKSLWLFPAALLTLICSKGYSVAKSTLVPSAVQRPQDLVEANSKLAVSGALAGFLIAIPGVIIYKLAGPAWLLRLDIGVFLACAITALRLQVTDRGTDAQLAPEVLAGAEATEILDPDGWRPGTATRRDGRREAMPKPLPAGAIQVAAFAMGTLRSIVGFMTFLVAFGFRHQGRHGAPAWWYGVVLAASIGGNLVGAAVAPWLRARLREELILAGSAVMVAVAGIVAFLFNSAHSRPAATLLAGIVGLSAGAAKLSFDALVQRHVPAASQGRAFGRFEAGFQLAWVVGALVPVVIPLDLPQGFLIETLAAALAAGVYVAGTRMARLGQLPDWWPGVRPSTPRERWARRPAAGSTPTPAPAAPVGTAPTIAFGGADAVTTTMGAAPRVPPSRSPAGPYDDEADRPWLDPDPDPGPGSDPGPADFGSYPPPIPGPPPLGRPARPIPPPLAGPPPRAAPLAPRAPRQPPGDGSVE